MGIQKTLKNQYKNITIKFKRLVFELITLPWALKPYPFFNLKLSRWTSPEETDPISVRMKHSRAGCLFFVAVFFGVFFWPLPGTEQEISDRIMPCSIRPYQCQSFTSLYIFLVKFYGTAPLRLHHWHPLSKELITSAVSLKVVPTGALRAFPVSTAWLLLWASWACSLILGRYLILQQEAGVLISKSFWFRVFLGSSKGLFFSKAEGANVFSAPISVKVREV